MNTNNDIPFQALQEIQVKTSGFEAEFGGATGGVINGVTKSGSNDFHGEFGMAFGIPKLNARPRPVRAVTLVTQADTATTGQGVEYYQQQRDAGTDEYPTAILSGPIIKDRLWFFAYSQPPYCEHHPHDQFRSGFWYHSRSARTELHALAALGATSTQTATEKTIYNYSSLRLDAAPVRFAAYLLELYLESNCG